MVILNHLFCSVTQHPRVPVKFSHLTGVKLSEGRSCGRVCFDMLGRVCMAEGMDGFVLICLAGCVWPGRFVAGLTIIPT